MPRPEPSARRAWSAGGRRPGPVDLVVVVGVVVAFAVRFHLGRHAWFFADDFALAGRRLDLRGAFEPYNGHCSATLVVIYQGVLSVSGLRSFTLLRVVALLAGAALPVALYLRARRPLGAPVAAVLAAPFLWTHPASYVAQQLAYPLVLAGAAGLATVLPRRGSRSDRVVAAVLGVVLLTSAVGALLAGVAIVHSAWCRADRSRWLAVATPSALWALWWTTIGREAEPMGEPVGWAAALAIVWRGLLASFDSVALGHRGGGVLVGLAFAGNLVWRGRRSDGAQAVAWGVGLVAWWLVLVRGRGAEVDVGAVRYSMVGAVFVLLSLIPEEVVSWSRLAGGRRPAGAGRRWVPAGVGVLGVLVVSVVTVPAYLEARDAEDLFARAVQEQVVVGRARPRLLPADARLPVWVGYLTPRELDGLGHRWGLPGEASSGAMVDRLVAQQLALAEREPAGGRSCGPPSVLVATPAADATVLIDAGPTGASVSVRRFGPTFRSVGRLEPGRAARLVLRSSLVPTPWEVRVEGACRVRVR